MAIEFPDGVAPSRTSLARTMRAGSSRLRRKNLPVGSSQNRSIICETSAFASARSRGAKLAS